MFEEEPLDRFRQRALALAGRMRFDPFLVKEAISTLTCSLGTEWVVGEAGTQQRGITAPWSRLVAPGACPRIRRSRHLRHRARRGGSPTSASASI